MAVAWKHTTDGHLPGNRPPRARRRAVDLSLGRRQPRRGPGRRPLAAPAASGLVRAAEPGPAGRPAAGHHRAVRRRHPEPAAGAAHVPTTPTSRRCGACCCCTWPSWTATARRYRTSTGSTSRNVRSLMRHVDGMAGHHARFHCPRCFSTFYSTAGLASHGRQCETRRAQYSLLPYDYAAHRSFTEPHKARAKPAVVYADFRGLQRADRARAQRADLGGQAPDQARRVRLLHAHGLCRRVAAQPHVSAPLRPTRLFVRGREPAAGPVDRRGAALHPGAGGRAPPHRGRHRRALQAPTAPGHARRL